MRVHRATEGGEPIASPRAYVATVSTRLAINELRSARARREQYVGEWLPEPILTDGVDDPAQRGLTKSRLTTVLRCIFGNGTARLSQSPRLLRLNPHAGRHATGRAVDRMRLALRAYDQRAERRAALDGWLAACAALSSRRSAPAPGPHGSG